MHILKEDIIRDMVKKWKHILGLQHWTINIFIKDRYYPEDKRIQADIEEDLKYLEADITIYKSFWDDDPMKQEVTIAHELAHLVLCPLHPYLPPIADDVLEGVVQHLAMSVYQNQQ